MKRVIFLLILMICLLPSFVVADSHQPQILIIYQSSEDLSSINTMLSNQDLSDVEINQIQVENLQVSDITSHDMIIFASTEEFSTDDAVELALQNFIATSNHQLIMITPFLDEFSGDLLNNLGVDGIEDIEEGDAEAFQWEITQEISAFGYNPSDQFEHTGSATMVQLENGTQLISSFTDVTGDSEEIADITLPRPAVWNVTDQAASVYVVPVGLYLPVELTPSNLELNQGEDFIDNIVQSIVQYTVSILPTTVGNDDTDPNDTEEGDDGILPNFGEGLGPITPEFSIIAAALALILLFYSKILQFFAWLTRKGYGLALFVVGAFYNIQDRTLTHGEVTMNQARSDILDYLNHVGIYGAHLREIKSLTKMGSGSLLWHLQVLEDYGYVEKYSVGSYTIFVSHEFTFDYELKEIELKLQSKYTLDLLEYLSNQDGLTITLSDIEEKTGINRRPVRRLLYKLEEYELITIDKYPQMTISIEKFEKIKELYLSFYLRDTFTFERSSPEIEYREE